MLQSRLGWCLCVVCVEREENESLWKMYQLRRDVLKKTYAAQHIRSLSTATEWQPAIFKAELSTDNNEFYLFHGTGSRSAQIICEHGFDERVVNRSTPNSLCDTQCKRTCCQSVACLSRRGERERPSGAESGLRELSSCFHQEWGVTERR
jgi:hypothetical protein